MTADERTILLGHAADLRTNPHGLPLVADLIVKIVLENDRLTQMSPEHTEGESCKTQ